MSKLKYPGIVRAARRLKKADEDLAVALEATDPALKQEVATEVERETGERLEELK
jgi:hypothetical protein